MMGRDRWMLAAVCVLTALGFFLQIRIAEAVPRAGFFMPYALGAVCGIAAMFAFTAASADGYYAVYSHCKNGKPAANRKQCEYAKRHFIIHFP